MLCLVAGVPGVCGEVLGLLALQRGQVLLQSFQEAAGSLREGTEGWGSETYHVPIHTHTTTDTHTYTHTYKPQTHG